ncbi:HNH endonuclease [Chishuiella changwenlii]|uniref:HNH endonuclease n=1 Tax=Chishuiella changwenlii TaxID=1434701 RepID=A0A1M6ZQB7_9FLAO|nr:HNH endonuclease [Chishuiella changwenlii]GGE92906.1 HNH endonuclease [Chishuiella changwenlii]SHL32620.1 HNH endonuclease [Chishuiella changwenlii]
MKKLNILPINVEDVANLIINDYKQQAKKELLNANIEYLKDFETEYIEKANQVKLFEIERYNEEEVVINKKLMINYYENRFLLENSGARKLYDEILIMTKRCPYCTIGTVKTIDHFLPKSYYPYLALTPSNLVPSCTDCNKGVLHNYPSKAEEQSFHPYFDDVESVIWIKSELMISDSLFFQYKVISEKPQEWDEVKYQRAQRHFNDYNINELFSLNANDELNSIREKSKDMFYKNKDLLKEDLEDSYASCVSALGLMHWKTIMYRELSTNDWFLNGCEGNDYLK